MLNLLFSPFRRKRIKRSSQIKEQDHFAGQAIRLGRRKDKKMSHAEPAKAQRVDSVKAFSGAAPVEYRKAKPPRLYRQCISTGRADWVATLSSGKRSGQYNILIILLILSHMFSILALAS
jgi:hypothetical protein